MCYVLYTMYTGTKILCHDICVTAVNMHAYRTYSNRLSRFNCGSVAVVLSQTAKNYVLQIIY